MSPADLPADHRFHLHRRRHRLYPRDQMALGSPSPPAKRGVVVGEIASAIAVIANFVRSTGSRNSSGLSSH